jgi:hypothetical protein
MTLSQWERLLKNSGTWVGSFTQLSPEGEVRQDIPTVVALKPLEGGSAMRQEITKQPPGAPLQEQVLEYRSLARSVLFFDNGAFSQGSIQWGPFSEFGAELGLIAANHRLRLVQLFDKQSQLSQITLIREHLEGTAPSTRPLLTIEALLGTWAGACVTLYPDWSRPQTYHSRLHIQRQGDTLHQTLSMEAGPIIESQGQIHGNRILFASGSQTVQVLCLPDGASSTCPTHIQPRQPIFLEAGWMVDRDRRQRLIRRYTEQGSWGSLTLVTETRIQP